MINAIDFSHLVVAARQMLDVSKEERILIAEKFCTRLTSEESKSMLVSMAKEGPTDIWPNSFIWSLA